MQNVINPLKLEMIDIFGYILLLLRRRSKKLNIKNGLESISDFIVITPNLVRGVENRKIGKSGGGKKLDPLKKIPTLIVQNNRS